MTDHTPMIGTAGTLVAVASIAAGKIEELDLYVKFGISCIGLVTALLTLAYMSLRLWHKTYKKE